ncbi:hypothetical protein AB685_27850 [Bacillus sp. LL01]|uniref:hypothetical protein n=1 Tax=Bacillus sp. LL01 TaxID=1665556 RepID=UPI00064D098F|nr:hypothetical protein [Bacillus sp. LL01]KMJ55315.1 hypothetical protein AB685_27850 [Bacillus sp. LL01]
MSDKIKDLEEKIEGMERNILSLQGTISSLVMEISRTNEKVMLNDNRNKELQDKINILEITANGLQIKINAHQKVGLNNVVEIVRKETRDQESKRIRTSNESNIRGSFQFTDDELSIIYRAVFFESRNYEEIDANGYLGNATSDILKRISDYNKVIADPFYVTNYISKAD